MGWASKASKKVAIPRISSPQQSYELNDYSLGMDSFLSNDKFPLKNGAANMWRLAQDARIPTLGEYETRKGFDYFSQARGEQAGPAQTSTTGAADQPLNETTWQAQPYTATSTGRMPKLEVRLKNDAAATGSVAIELWSNNGGSPGSLISKSTIAGSSVTGSYTYLVVNFPDAPDNTNGTQYWIVGHTQLFGDNSYKWSSTTSATTAKTSPDFGATWNSTSYALNFRTYNTVAINATRGLYRAYKSDGTKAVLAATESIVFTTDDNTGTNTNIKTGLNASSTNYRFATINDVVYYVNNYDGLRKWDFTTESQVNGTNYSLIASHKGLLFLAGGADPNAVVYSNFGLPEVFTSTDLVYADVPKNGDPVTALVPLNGVLFIICRNNKFILSGDDNETFRVDEAPDQKGTYTQETVCTDKNFMYYLSDDGVYRSNGSEAQLMSEHIYQDIKNIPDKSKCVLAINKGRLYLWFASAGSGFNDRCYVWNLNYSDSGRDCVESLDTGAYVARAVSGFQDSDDLIVGSSRVAQIFWQERSSNDYSNLGADLNFELDTHYMTFGSPASLHAIRYWRPRFAASTTNNTVGCYYAYDLYPTAFLAGSPDVQGTVGYQWGDPGTVWGQFTWGTNREIQPQLDIPGEYRRIQLRYKHTGARQYVRFLGHSLTVQTRRMR